MTRNEWNEYVWFGSCGFTPHQLLLLVKVMREKGSMVGSVSRGVQGSIGRRVDRGCGQQRGMVSNGGLVVSGTMAQERSMVSGEGRIVGRSSDQRSRSVHWGVQGGGSHHWSHDSCPIPRP